MLDEPNEAQWMKAQASNGEAFVESSPMWIFMVEQL
jgi:hypothetical protein